MRKDMILERIDALKGMHTLMRHMNNEEAYMAWVNWFPDEPSEEDFHDVAADDESFFDCVDAFERISKRYSSDGYYFEKEEFPYLYTKREAKELFQKYLKGEETLVRFYPNLSDFDYRYLVREEDIAKVIVDFGFRYGVHATVTDCMDNFLCNTIGYFLDHCDQEFRCKIIEDLVNYQMSGDTEFEYKMIKEDFLDETLDEE